MVTVEVKGPTAARVEVVLGVTVVVLVEVVGAASVVVVVNVGKVSAGWRTGDALFGALAHPARTSPAITRAGIRR